MPISLLSGVNRFLIVELLQPAECSGRGVREHYGELREEHRRRVLGE